MRAKRILRFEGQELGAFSVPQLLRMAERGLIDNTSEYWSEKGLEWRPLSSLISDLDDAPAHLGQLKGIGFQNAVVPGASARPL